MKIILVVAIVCLSFIPDITWTLPTCPQKGQCPANANCAADGQPCECNSGFHENSGSTACVQDIALGATCPTKGAVCADEATCVNTAPQGAAEVLKCTCKPDFYEKTEADGSKKCSPHIQPDVICTIKDAATECVANATCVNVAPATEAASLKCKCDAGFHAMSGACQIDLEPGANCAVKDSETECVTNAVCVNVAATGQPESLQCSCSAGFHDMSGTCEADIPLGGNCTMADSDKECAGSNTVCANVTEAGQGTALQCTCKSGFHLTFGANQQCEADKAPGTTCLIKGSNECVKGAACRNIAAAGAPEEIKCVCTAGYHVKTPAEGASPICEADIFAGANCTQENNKAECVDNATCKNTQAAGQTAELKCVCDTDYHEIGGNGSTLCAPDTCEDTKTKCDAAGMSTCLELNAYLGCMLTGVCNPTADEQMEVFKGAMDGVRAALADDCAATETTTCKGKVTACLITFLKEDTNCTTVEALGTCLADTQASCTAPADEKIYKLANTFMTNTNQNLSCVCLKATSACVDAQTNNYEAADATATTKCNAAKELFSCALTSPCDLSKGLDLQTVSAMWSRAMGWAQVTGCKETITEEAATTCALQLTRCALIYREDKKGATNKSSECRAAETFRDCLNNTGQCNDANAAQKKLFTDQYALVSATCMCDNRLNECHDAVGVLPSDPVVACPKLVDFSMCIMGAKCNLADSNSSLFTAQDWYLRNKNSVSCNITSDNTCASAVSVCSDQLIANLSKTGVTVTQMCDYTTVSMMQVNAANCTSAVSADVDLTTSVHDAAVYRLQSLGCDVPTCNGTFEDLMGCKSTYEQEFMSAGTDNKKKCTAKNTMVACLRGHRCNTYMRGLIQKKYNALQKVQVAGCDMEALDPTSVAPTPDKTLLTLLACLAAAYVVLKL